MLAKKQKGDTKSFIPCQKDRVVQRQPFLFCSFFYSSGNTALGNSRILAVGVFLGCTFLGCMFLSAHHSCRVGMMLGKMYDIDEKAISQYHCYEGKLDSD